MSTLLCARAASARSPPFCTRTQKRNTAASQCPSLRILLVFVFLIFLLCRTAALFCAHRRHCLLRFNERVCLRVDALMPAIVVRIHGQTALFQQMIDLLGQHAVQHGKQRHADHHAREAHHAAEQQNGEHDPEARQSGGVAEDFRSEDIAVKLLQQQHKNDEI